ncbi:MAG: apolipoprotein N-acyltransferase [Aquabacterium sp.]
MQLAGAALLCWQLQGRSVRGAFALGWAFSLAWLCGAVWWLFISLHRYGQLDPVLAATAVAALAAALAVYLGGAMALRAWMGGRQGPLAQGLSFAGAWLLAELARAAWFTGFPWGASGYAHVDGPLGAAAPWIGVYGMGAVAALVGGWVAGAFVPQVATTTAQRMIVAGLAVAALALAPLAYRDFTRPTGDLTVELVQTHVAQDEKFAAERMPQALAWLGQTLRASDAPLVIAPETAIPLLPQQLEDLLPGYWKSFISGTSGPGRTVMVGAPLGDFQRGYTNSVLGISLGAVGYRYDKWHLVPFGEFIPPGFRWFTEALGIPLGDFARGAATQPSFEVGGQRVAPTICYEDLFGEDLATRFSDARNAPTLLANVSNIGWFGDTVAIDQHLHISRLRAMEFQRAMVRATNTGATAAIDHRGQVLARLPAHTRGTLRQRVEGRSGITPYATWSAQGGLWPLWGAALALLLVAAVRRSR